MSDPITDWGLKQVESRGWEDYLWIGLAGACVGFIIGWFAGLAKTRQEIKNLKEDWRKASGDNVEKLSQIRAIANSKRQDLNLAKKSMRDALLVNKEGTDNIQAIRQCRDEMCNIYQNDYLPATQTYLEMIPRLVDQRDARIRAETELIPGLESVSGFLALVNRTSMLEKVRGSKPYKVKRAVRDGLLLRVKMLVPWWCIKLRWKLTKFKKETEAHLRD